MITLLIRGGGCGGRHIIVALAKFFRTHLPGDFTCIHITLHRNIATVSSRDGVILHGGAGQFIPAKLHQCLQALFHAQQTEFHVGGDFQRAFHPAAGHRHRVGKPFDLIPQITKFGCCGGVTAGRIVAQLGDLHLQVAKVGIDNVAHVPQIGLQQLQPLRLTGQQNRGAGRIIDIAGRDRRDFRGICCIRAPLLCQTG